MSAKQTTGSAAFVAIRKQKRHFGSLSFPCQRKPDRDTTRGKAAEWTFPSPRCIVEICCCPAPGTSQTMNLPLSPRPNIPRIFRAWGWTLLALFLMVQPSDGYARELFSASIDTLASPVFVQDPAATPLQDLPSGDHPDLPPALRSSHSAIFPELSLRLPDPTLFLPRTIRALPSLPRPPPRI